MERLLLGRRGLATLLANTNLQAAMGMLRQATLNTTQGFYIKQIPEVTIDAMNALESSLSRRQAERIRVKRLILRCGGMGELVETGGLENRCTGNRTGGSNPSPSAT